MASNFCKLHYLAYLMEYSCLKTLASKHKTSLSKTIDKFNDGTGKWGIPYETKQGNKRRYGTYDEDQTAGSGYVRPEDLTPELAEHFSGKDRAVCRFWENHSLLEPEYADLQAILSKMSLFMDLNTKQEVDFSPAEKGSE